jgi:hypothetical protein
MAGEIPWMKMAATALGLMAILASLAALGSISHYKAAPQLSAYDTDWNDLSDLHRAFRENGFNTSCVASTPLSLRKLDSPSSTALFIIGVERDYTSEEVKVIMDFVERHGGTVIVADDFGFGNTLAYEVGLRFSKLPVRAFGPGVGGKLIPVQAKSPGLYSTYNILLNDASYFEVSETENIVVLGNSPATCWIDLDRDVEKDPDEVIASVPVVVRVRRGFGSMVFISDPSMFINGMIHERSNLEFALALVRPLRNTPDRTVVFDESRHTPEGAGEIVQRAVYSVTENVMQENWMPLYLAIILTIMTAGAIVLMRRPSHMRHVDILEDPERVMLDEGFANYSLYYKIRAIILERTRIRHHMAPWDFYTAFIATLPEDLSEWELRSLVEQGPINTAGLAVMERAIHSEYGRWQSPADIEIDLEPVEVD